MMEDRPSRSDSFTAVHSRTGSGRPGPKPAGRRRAAVVWSAVALTGIVLAIAWLGIRAAEVRAALSAASELVPRLKVEVLQSDPAAAAATIELLKAHTAKARTLTSDPLWSVASTIPWAGQNFSATRDVAKSADEVAGSAAGPLVDLLQTLDWQSLTPNPAGIDLAPLAAAQPTLAKAAQTVGIASGRLDEIDTTALIRQLAGPLTEARDELRALKRSVDAAADVALIAPAMLGSESPRSYLLMIQNNAEARATGGIPGALAKLTVDKGQLSLSAQTSAGALGEFTPPLAVDPQQELVYTKLLGTSMQDANLTPDFPTAAATSLAMWEIRMGERLDGVLSLDPVSLSYILNATGPVALTDPALQHLDTGKMPSTLTAQNVVKSLLSDVYAEIPAPDVQDLYFAAVAQQIFGAVSSGATNPQKLMDGLARGVDEGRIRVWSGSASEQQAIRKYPLAGSVTGPGESATRFGLYFNDATGAKMDYYVKRTAQLNEVCGPGGLSQVKLTVMATNTAPADSATSLPKYVTGGGVYGVPAGTVQTNVVAYGPAATLLAGAELNGRSVGVDAQFHSRRPVGTVTMRLAPGETQTLDFNFLKVEAASQPTLAMTPTVFPVDEVALTPDVAGCKPVDPSQR